MEKTKISSLVLILSFCPILVFGQLYFGGGYQHSYNLPIYDLSPPTTQSSPFVHVDIKYRGQGHFPILESLYGQIDFNIQAYYQDLGNPKVMGYAIGILPDVRFRLKDWENSRLSFGGGLGIGYTNNPYDKATNPDNQALGTPMNIYAQIHLDYLYQLNRQWLIGAELGIHHLSNSFFSYPNLGVNIPAAGFSLYYKLKDLEDRRTNEDLLSEAIYKTPWRPFVRGVFGVTERGFDGPHYAVYGASLGINKKFAANEVLLLGGEYLFDESSYYFLSRAKGEESDEVRRQSQRWMVFIGHEYLFGHLSLVTEAGVYLTKNYNQQSIVSTKIGLNFYPFNNIFRYKHQVAIGAFIRAYFLRADFFEINLSYRL